MVFGGVSVASATEVASTSTSNQLVTGVFTKADKLEFTNNTGSAVTIYFETESGGATTTLQAGQTHNFTTAAGAITIGDSRDCLGTITYADGSSVTFSAYNPDFGRADLEVGGDTRNMTVSSGVETWTVQGHTVTADMIEDGNYKHWQISLVN